MEPRPREVRCHLLPSIGSVDCTGETDDNLSVTDFTQPMALFPVSKLFESIAAGMTISIRQSGRASQSNL